MKERKTSEFVAGAITNIVMIALINSVLLWRSWTRGVVLESWIDILWAANLSLILQVVGNLLLSFYRPAWFYSLTQAILAAAGLLSVIVFYIVFPLDFSVVAGGWLNALARGVLVIGMVGTSIAVVVHLVRLAIGRPYDLTQAQ